MFVYNVNVMRDWCVERRDKKTELALTNYFVCAYVAWWGRLIINLECGKFSVI